MIHNAFVVTPSGVSALDAPTRTERLTASLRTERRLEYVPLPDGGGWSSEITSGNGIAGMLLQRRMPALKARVQPEVVGSERLTASLRTNARSFGVTPSGVPLYF